MCSRYQPPHVQLADWDEIAGSLAPTFEFKSECFPGYDAPVILDGGVRAPVRACFGMLPHWAKYEKRSIVVVPPEDYERWLESKDDAEIRSMLQLFEADQFAAEALASKKINAPKLPPQPLT